MVRLFLNGDCSEEPSRSPAVPGGKIPNRLAVGWGTYLSFSAVPVHTRMSPCLAPNWTLWRQTSDLSRAMVKPTQFRRWKLYTHTHTEIKLGRGPRGESKFRSRWDFRFRKDISADAIQLRKQQIQRAVKEQRSVRPRSVVHRQTHQNELKMGPAWGERK